MLINGDKAKDANAIALNGPQYGWTNPSFVYSVGLHGGGFDVSGNTPFGFPWVFFGQNESITWGSTYGVGDQVDVYQETLNPDDPEQYLYEDEYIDFEKREEIIKVKDADDTTFNVRSNIHGLVKDIDEDSGIAYTEKRSWDGHEVESLIAGIRTTQVDNFDDFLEHASDQAMTINLYYADLEGDIGYTLSGWYPDRPESQDWRLPAIGNGDMEW